MSDNKSELKRFEVFLKYKLGDSFKRDFKNAAKEVARKLVDRTPRYFDEYPESGNTIANWNITFDGSEDSSYNETIADFDRNDTKSDLVAAIQTEKLMDDATITFSNSSPGIKSLEFGLYPNPPKMGSYNKYSLKEDKYEKRSSGGFSRQAPQGIVGVTAMEWTAIVQDAISRRVGK